MKTMRKLQVAAAAASLFAVAGVAQAATLNSSGSVIAAEAIFPASAGALGNNTKIKAPAYVYQYEGGVVAASRQIFKVAVNLTGGAQWARDTTRVGDAFLPFFQTDGRQALTIIANATVNGVRGRVAVLNNADPSTGRFAIRLNRIEAGDTVGGSPLVSSALSAVTYVFEVVNNTPDNGVSLEQLSLQFSTFKPAGAVMLANSEVDTVTTNLDQYPTIYNLASLSVDTNTAACLEPAGAIRLQAVSGNNDPAVISQEDFTTNGGALRDVGNYILIRRATRMDLAKSGDRLVQTTNSFQTNEGTTPINGIGGTGGGRFTFKPATTQVANVYGGNGTGVWTVSNSGTIGNAVYDGVGTFPERQTSGDERAAKLGVLTFSNLNNPQDRLLDLDPYHFHIGTTTQLANNASSFEPSDVGAVTRVVGDFTPVTPPISTNGNIYGGVDVNTAPITATPLSGALIVQFDAKPGAFAAGSALSLQRGNLTCADTVPGTALGGSLIAVPQSATVTRYYWRFSNADLATAAGGTNGTLAGAWTICYNVNGETTIPAATFSNVAVTLLKDDTTEQPIQACSANLASIYGGVKIDVRNFQLHNVLATSTEADKLWRGLLRVINNSETDTATVEAQYIHDDGRYGPWGTLGTWAPRSARYVLDTEVFAKLTTPVANANALVNNAPPTIQTTRLRISADVSTLRVQNYIFHAGTQALTEVSSSQGADFVNVDSSNRDHIDQDAQFDIVKDTATMAQIPTTALKGAIAPSVFVPAP